MKKLLITNEVNYHYEIIPGIIKYYQKIINEECQIYLYLKHPNESFLKIIFEMFKNLNEGYLYETYDYYINLNKNYYQDIIHKPNIFYISHNVEEEHPQIYHLTPLSKQFITCDVLPFANQKIKVNKPIFIIQGNICDSKRLFNQLEELLEIKRDFTIKIIGKFRKKYQHPTFFKNPKINLKINLNFEDYHKEFLDCYAILPLVDEEHQPKYFKSKLTSSINYGKAYNLKFLIDKKLNDIYKLNGFTYQTPIEFKQQFIKLLDSFN